MYFFTLKFFINLNHISCWYDNNQRLPGEFTSLAGIDAEGTIIMKNLDGKEWKLGLRLDKGFRYTKRYLLSSGWSNFMRCNNLSDGDECVFKFRTRDGKMYLTKVTKKKKMPRGRDDKEKEDKVVKHPHGSPAKHPHGSPSHQKSNVVYF